MENIYKRSSREYFEKLAQSAHFVTSVDQWRELGFTEIDLGLASLQVAGMVGDYLIQHPNEMLPKEPSDIRANFLLGRSVLIVSSNGSGPQVLGHGTNYTNFDNGEEGFLGDIQVSEIGTVVVDEAFQGKGLGTKGTKILSEVALNGYRRVLRLATVKQAMTAHVFDKNRIVMVGYHTFPYLTYLTCTCPNSSERGGFGECVYRRGIDETTPEIFTQILDPRHQIGNIKCTLVLSDIDMAHEFEARCRDLHSEMGGQPLFPRSIDKGLIEEADWFFTRLEAVAKQNER